MYGLVLGRQKLRENSKEKRNFRMLDDIFRGSALHSLSFKESVSEQHVRVREQDCVDREREGSTCPSRGKHRLTVYRAHASQMDK